MEPLTIREREGEKGEREESDDDNGSEYKIVLMYLITILIKNINNNPPPSPSLKATWLTATTALLPSVRLATAMSTREIAPYLDHP
jgi:hypothetical protein